MMSFTRTRFKEWLDTMPADEVAGYRKQETCCPLAKFLKWDGGTLVWVGIGSYRLGDFVGQLPNWAYVLRKAVDTNERENTVTAGEVRVLLMGIEAEAFVCGIDP